MTTARKSIVMFALASSLLPLVLISGAEGQSYTFTETWNYDGVHPEVDAGDSREGIDLSGSGYSESLGMSDQDLYGDNHWKWNASIGMGNWPCGYVGDSGAAAYTFSQSSGSLSVNVTAHAHTSPLVEPYFWPHWNDAHVQHTLELVGYPGWFGGNARIRLENASAQGTLSSTGSYGQYNVYLVLRCYFNVATLISKDPDTYSVEEKDDNIALVTSSYGWFNYPYWYLNCPSIASGEYGLVDIWNQIYGYDYSTLPPTEVGQKYVSGLGVARVHIFIGAEAEVYASATAEDCYADAQLNIGKLTIEDLYAPVVSTSPATDVTKTSATLNGSVTDDGGEACQYRFRYKEEKGDYVYTLWTGSVTTGESFSQAVTGLKPNGTYYFSAQAKNSAGESAWGYEQIFVARPGEAPTASFKYEPQKPRPGQAIVFDASKSEDKDGWIVSYEWDFGDGTSASTLFPIYEGKSYEGAGEYLVRLIVIDDAGLVGTKTWKIKVRDTESEPWPPGGVQWEENGHWYEVVVSSESLYWADAQAAAVAKGGYLATITSAAENEFVYNLTVSTPGAWGYSAEWAIGPWLGGYQDRNAADYSEPSGGWQWVTGEPWEYSGWLQQPYPQPDNWLDIEDYLLYWGYWQTTPTWNDAGGAVHSYVIEYDPDTGMGGATPDIGP